MAGIRIGKPIRKRRRLGHTSRKHFTPYFAVMYKLTIIVGVSTLLKPDNDPLKKRTIALMRACNDTEVEWGRSHGRGVGIICSTLQFGRTRLLHHMRP